MSCRAVNRLSTQLGSSWLSLSFALLIIGDLRAAPKSISERRYHRQRPSKEFLKKAGRLQLLERLPIVFQPTGWMAARWVAVSPMDNPSFGVPYVNSTKRNSVAFAERGNP